MKSKIAGLLLTIAGLNAFAIPHETGGFVVPMAIEIQYVSIGSGIDSEFKGAVDNLLAFKKVSGQISYVKESGWGHEGESTVCIQFNSFNDADATLNEIAALKNTVPSRFTQVRSLGSCEAGSENVDPRAASVR